MKGVLKYEQVKLKEVGLSWSLTVLEPWSITSNENFYPTNCP